MARTQGTKIENNFSAGFVTETTELKYPRNSCVDADNVIIDKLGTVSRRPPLDIETSVQTPSNLGIALTVDQSDLPTVEYIWTSVGGDGSTSFLVIQNGRYIKFFDISNSAASCRDTAKSFIIDLNAYIVSGSSLLPKDYPCGFSSGRGRLIVVNKAIEPIYVTYDAVADGIVITPFTIKFRDFEGLPSSIGIDSRPTATVAGITTSNPEHLYNLYNQGWGLTDALTQWDTARTDLPSLCDTTGIFRASETDAFDPAKVGPKNAGNSLAPRGHFILSLGLEERSGISGVSVGGSSGSIGFGEAVVSLSATSTGFAGATTGAITVSLLANINDNDTLSSGALVRPMNSTVSVPSGTLTWLLGKTFSAPKKIFSVSVKGPALARIYQNLSGSPATTITVSLYGVTGVLGTSLGTFLGSTVLTNTTISENALIVSSNRTTLYDAFQVQIVVNVASYTGGIAHNQTVSISSIDLFEALDTAESYTRPEVVGFYAGRAWYASPGYSQKGSQIFFSQVLERDDQFGLCYQSNDPTSEYFFDLLASDGGTVNIPEIANVVGLFAMRSALVVFATNGVWIIRGNSAEGFSATSYRVEKVTSVGCVSRYSICDVKGLPVWMGEDGIYTLEYDPNYNAFQLKSLSDERVRSYVKDTIPAQRKRFSKIIYDTTAQVLRVLFNSSATIIPGQDFYYNKILNLDMISKAWYPFTFGTDIPLVGGINCYDANRVYPATVKFIGVTSAIGASQKMYFFEFKNVTNHQDFTDFAGAAIANNSALINAYESYFVTAPMIDAELMKFFQSNYVMTFFNTVANSSCFVQGQFDWTSGGGSGKWSTAQQAYLAINDSRVGYRKLKIRGKGRSLSLKFYSDAAYPFEIIGWAIYETANAGV